MRRFIRTLLRAGRDRDAWPVLLMLLAVLVPAVCLLWFMSAAMRNERLAARQKLAEVYRVQLSASQTQLQRRWQETMAEIEKLAATNPPPVAFARLIQSSLVDTAILFDERGHIVYPNAPSPVSSDFAELELKWQEASRLESLRRYIDAAKQYDAVARTVTNTHAAARAFQSEARCLVQATQNDAAIRLVDEIFASERFSRAADPQGRLIAANAELMALELIRNRTSQIFESISRRLAARLTAYENPVLAAPQRLFLMNEVQTLVPGRMEFATLAAEQLAAQASESYRTLDKNTALQRAAGLDLWQFTTPDRRVLALIGSKKLPTVIQAALASENLPSDVAVSLIPPNADSADAFVTVAAGEQMPGWRLALMFKERNLFDIAAGHQASVYLWTAILVVAGMGTLTALAVQLVRRQMAVARLKNDLAATVSHELKTPLSSMRVLVETLLAEKFDEPKAREYLQLIAQENERLGRLIQNFLTFSRMERKKHTFQFSPVSVRQVIDAAIESVHARFDVPGCRLEVRIENDLPPVIADTDALTTALINLLENAWKYSEEIKHIVLCARAEDGRVLISVTDNGIGIKPRERRRIFQPFYQIDQRLSRKGGGCGLGLSIVQFIAEAHQGSVSVESEPGRGSTFSISLPVVSGVAAIREEAIA